MFARVEQYLAHRRGVGFPLYVTGHLLRTFARFTDKSAPGQPLTSLLAMRWINIEMRVPLHVLLPVQPPRRRAREGYSYAKLRSSAGSH
jgi:hypothetical protein